MEPLPEYMYQRLRFWAMAKVKFNRRYGVYRSDTAEDYFQQAVLGVLELVNEGALVAFDDELLALEAIRFANRSLDRRGYRSGPEGEQIAPYPTPVDPRTIRGSRVMRGGTSWEDWFHFDADVRRVLMEVNPILWTTYKWLIKRVPVTRQRYQKEYKARQRVFGPGENTPRQPGYGIQEIAQELGVHRNTVTHYRTKIKAVLMQELNDYTFLSGVLRTLDEA